MSERRSSKICVVVKRPDHHCGDDLVILPWLHLDAMSFINQSESWADWLAFSAASSWWWWSSPLVSIESFSKLVELSFYGISKWYTQAQIYRVRCATLRLSTTAYTQNRTLYTRSFAAFAVMTSVGRYHRCRSSRNWGSHTISRKRFDLESPNVTQNFIPVGSTTIPDMTSLPTSGRHLSKFEQKQPQMPPPTALDRN